MDIAFHIPVWLLWILGSVGALGIIFLACFGIASMLALMKMRW